MNKQRFVTLLVLLLVFTYAKGQDKIITLQDDTFFCKIVSISQDYIQFTYKGEKSDVVGRFIAVEQVQEYYWDSQGKPFDRWRIGVQGGGAYLLSSFAKSKMDMEKNGILMSHIDKYHSQLRNGIYTDIDIHYLLTYFFGLGLKYSLFTTSAQLNCAVVDTDNNLPTYYFVNEKHKFYMNYIGPSIVFQHWLGKNHKFRINEELSVGYTLYRAEYRVNPHQYKFEKYGITFANNMLTEGYALGGSIQAGFEYYPLSWLSIGANAGLSTAKFKTLKISNNEESISQKLDAIDHIDMSYLGYSISVRFHF